MAADLPTARSRFYTELRKQSDPAVNGILRPAGGKRQGKIKTVEAVVNGSKLSYEVVGSQGSWVVFTHGLGHDMNLWRPIVTPIAQDHRVLIWDLRGAGRSAKPPGPYNPKLLARDLAALLAEAGASPVHLVGHSAGGVISQRLALDYPRQAASLTLISTSSEVGERAAKAWQKLADKIEREGFPTPGSERDRSFSPAFAKAHPDVVERTQAEAASGDPRAYAALARAMSSYNWTAELGRIEVPVLILQGGADRLTPPGGSWILKRNLPRAKLIIVPDAGHNLPVEQPELVRAAVEAFVSAIDLCRPQGV